MQETLSAAENFIEQMGLITQTDGGPRIAGRIVGLLIVEGRPFSLAEMAERLKISKASASTNARSLASSGMIRQVAHAGDRQDYYELGDDPYTRIVETVTARMQEVARLVLEAEAKFPDDSGEARKRVRELAEFYQRLAAFFAGWPMHPAPHIGVSTDDAQSPLR
ncbi:GbsR/MarR family transcriptional regulator [Devosia lacusdianchii]|uniref:GbsR/MarR family transcriptional regulator n=1 Tax=Devosia lacusdianchii TaxID=2917991 RepID=UPI001F0708D1|nr:MarR family transcriptional regulator [Devosia sp. JXJ CY 41]